MKNLIFIFSAIILMTASSCQKRYGCTEINAVNYSPSADINNGSCILPNYYNGGGNNNGSGAIQTAFIIYTDSSTDDITVYIDSVNIGIITDAITGIPACGDLNGLNIPNVTATSYSIYAENSLYYWYIVYTIDPNLCNTLLLEQLSGKALLLNAAERRLRTKESDQLLHEKFKMRK